MEFILPKDVLSGALAFLMNKTKFEAPNFYDCEYCEDAKPEWYGSSELESREEAEELMKLLNLESKYTTYSFDFDGWKGPVKYKVQPAASNVVLDEDDTPEYSGYFIKV